MFDELFGPIKKEEVMSRFDELKLERERKKYMEELDERCRLIKIKYKERTKDLNLLELVPVDEFEDEYDEIPKQGFWELTKFGCKVFGFVTCVILLMFVVLS